MSLNRTQAYKRKDCIRSGSIKYTYHLILKPQNYFGLAKMTFSLTEINQDPLIVDFSGERVIRVAVNEKSTKPQWQNGMIKISTNLNMGDNNISIVYSNKYDKSSGGLMSFFEEQEQYLFTLLQPNYANRIFPSFDQPNLKGKLNLRIVAPSSWVIISHSFPLHAQRLYLQKQLKINQISQQANDFIKEFVEFLDEMSITIFPESVPLPTYLFSFCAGKYQSITTQVSTVPITLYSSASVYNKLKKSSSFIFNVTIKCMDLFTQKFKMEYPFQKYDQTFIPVCFPELKDTAMQKPGNSIFDESYLLPQKDKYLTNFHFFNLSLVLSHELCHHWFGNCLTMEWWSDLWLNQSFAEMMSYVAIEKLNIEKILVEQFKIQASQVKENQFSMYLRDRITNGYVLDERTDTHPISTPIEDVTSLQSLFNGITYQKGALCLRQMCYLLGQTDFFIAISNFLKEYKWLNGNLESFMDEIRKINTEDADQQWEKVWLKSSSVSFIQYQWSKSNQQIFLAQRNFASEQILRSHKIKICFIYQDGSFDVMSDVIVKAAKSTDISYSKPKKSIKAIFLNYQSKSFMEVVIDLTSCAFLLRNIMKIKDFELRIEIIYNIQSMAFLKLLNISDYIDFLLFLIKHDEHQFIITRLLNNLRQVDRRYFKIAEGKRKLQQICNKIVDKLSQLQIHPKRKKAFWNYLNFQRAEFQKNCHLSNIVKIKQQSSEAFYNIVDKCIIFCVLPKQVSKIEDIIQNGYLPLQLVKKKLTYQTKVLAFFHGDSTNMPTGSYFILRKKVKARTNVLISKKKKHLGACLHYTKHSAIKLFEYYDDYCGLLVSCDVIGKVRLESDIREVVLSAKEYQQKLLSKIIDLIKKTGIPYTLTTA